MSSVISDFIIGGIVDNLTLFISKMHCIWCFLLNTVSSLMHWWNSPLNKTTQGLQC